MTVAGGESTEFSKQDGCVGVIGQEINLNRYFYGCTPLRLLEVIEADIWAIKGGIVRMLAEVTGGLGDGAGRRHLWCQRRHSGDVALLRNAGSCA